MAVSSPLMLILVSPLLPSRPLVARVFFNWPSMRLKVGPKPTETLSLIFQAMVGCTVITCTLL